jgi:hypothetical protein
MPVIIEKAGWPVWLGEAEAIQWRSFVLHPMMRYGFGRLTKRGATSETTARTSAGTAN